MTELIIKYTGDIPAAAARLGAEVEILSPMFAIITLDEAVLPLLDAVEEIEYYEAPKHISLFLSDSLYRACVPPVHLNYGLRGSGTIVAILDSGIDYVHPDFRNDDGTTRIMYLWDMTVIDGTPPPGFKDGTLYTADGINAALESENPLSIIPHTDFIGHGTAVAGVAAGNGRTRGGREQGVAPEASIIAVRLGRPGNELSARTTELMRAIKFSSDMAARKRMPCAINISFGTNEGTHHGNSVFEQYINEVAMQPRMSIIAAAGNEGSAGHHYSGILREGETDLVEFNVSGGNFNMYLIMLKDFADLFTIELLSPTGETTSILPTTAPERVYNLGRTRVRINMGIPTFYNVNREIFMHFDGGGAPITPGLWRLRIVSVNLVSGVYHLWLPTTEEVTRETAFTNPNPEATIAMPATADMVIAVGAYNAASDAAAEFSGRGFSEGPAMPGVLRPRPKPDIIAPGVNVITTRVGGGYDGFSGTSIAAPFVTGAAALLMEWGIVLGNDPGLYGEKIKAYLRLGATRSGHRAYPNNIWGYGTLCLRETMRKLEAGS